MNRPVQVDIGPGGCLTIVLLIAGALGLALAFVVLPALLLIKWLIA